MAAAPNVLEYMQSVHPPPMTAAIVQPGPTPWLLLPVTDLNGYYDEECEAEDDDGMHQDALSDGAVNQVITMATQATKPVAT